MQTQTYVPGLQICIFMSNWRLLWGFHITYFCLCQIFLFFIFYLFCLIFCGWITEFEVASLHIVNNIWLLALVFHLSKADGFLMSPSQCWISLILCDRLAVFLFAYISTLNVSISGGCCSHLLFMYDCMESSVYIKQFQSV